MLATPLDQLVRPYYWHSTAQLKIIIAQLTFEVVARGGMIQFCHDRASGVYSLVQNDQHDVGNEPRVLWRTPAELADVHLLGCATQLYSIVVELSKNDLKARWSRFTERLSVDDLNLIHEAAKEGYL